ncbi:hypothetical protein AVL62_11260 [Serinicoccus chungangensis]|uniref:DUF2891 domain-containing protein n=1 Tax=Serinicoccus chungangensis TaxID=767452 RepID=A0A0W8IEZ8_9MICO|nr:DUF2891 family protein [Serinicoccus chungangensis]KUG58470.1 hypothetical protein AVL62_11260 [Serinicoccus chungangensis]
MTPDAPRRDSRPDPTAHPHPHARAWSRIAREVIGTAYPWAPGHVVLGPDDTDVTPESLHPAFHGALDWHSCVHMQWSLVTLLTRYADALGAQERAATTALLSQRLTEEHLAVEVDYLRARPGFERPYGWAWAAQLAAAAANLAAPSERFDASAAVEGTSAPEAGTWARALAPLADLLADRVVEHLPRQAYPVRHGKHQNDAFALLLLRDAYRRLGREDVVRACEEAAVRWFGDDGPLATEDEPGGSDFLSPALTEALLMTAVLGRADGPDWLARALPGLGEGAHAHLLEPPLVLDPTHGQGAHLLGLALSRAWALRTLAPWVAEPAADRVRQAADEQEGAVLEQITDGDFMATHWLVSFALLADGAGP